LRDAQGCAARFLVKKYHALEHFVAVAVEEREPVANLSIAADEIGVAGISAGGVFDFDEARDNPIGCSLVHRSGGDFLVDAEMLFDGGDALERMVDLDTEADDVFNFFSEMIEFDTDDPQFARDRL